MVFLSIIISLEFHYTNTFHYILTSTFYDLRKQVLLNFKTCAEIFQNYKTGQKSQILFYFFVVMIEH